MSRLFPLMLTVLLALGGVIGPYTQCHADIAVIVNPNNPTEQLDQYQVKRIFLGRIGLFPNTRSKIEVLDQNADSETYRRFYEELIGFRLSELKRYRASYLFSGKGALPTSVVGHQEMKTYVLNQEGAVGYIDKAFVDQSVKVVYIWPE